VVACGRLKVSVPVDFCPCRFACRFPPKVSVPVDCCRFPKVSVPVDSRKCLSLSICPCRFPCVCPCGSDSLVESVCPCGCACRFIDSRKVSVPVDSRSLSIPAESVCSRRKRLSLSIHALEVESVCPCRFCRLKVSVPVDSVRDKLTVTIIRIIRHHNSRLLSVRSDWQDHRISKWALRGWLPQIEVMSCGQAEKQITRSISARMTM